MTNQSCPTLDELRSFSFGQTDAERREAVAAHLSECSSCQAAIQTVSDEDDTLVAAIQRQAAPAQYEDERGFQDALARIEVIGAEPTFDLQLALGTDEQSGIEQVGRYRLLEKLGEGGMGAVYKALHTKLKKIVAIKVLPAAQLNKSESVARFEREMEAVGKLDHPNIVRAMDADEHDGTHYLVMEYVRGTDLAKLVRDHGPLPVTDACELIRQAAIGLQHAHEHGLVHRDIKPGNLMLASGGRQPSDQIHGADVSDATPQPHQPANVGRSSIVKVLDLGLALLQGQHAEAERDLTSTGQLMGTLSYMAPEQGDDSHDVDIRADIYGLGATLYRLLGGQNPFPGDKYNTPVKMLMALVSEQPAPLVELRGDLPAGLIQVVERMMAKSAADRYSTPGEVAAALAPFASGHDLSKYSDTAAKDPRESELERSGTNSTDSHLSSAMTGTQPHIARQPTSKRSLAGEDRTLPTPSRKRIPSNWMIAALIAGILVPLAAALIYLVTDNGTLVIKCNEPGVKFVVTQHEKPVREIEFVPSEKEIRFRAGIYEVAILGANADRLEIEPRSFTVRRGEDVILTIKNKPASESLGESLAIQTEQAPGKLRTVGTWPQGPADNVLLGLVPRPTKLRGVKRWQMETSYPRSDIVRVSISPDGKLIACRTRLGDIRIYDAETLSLVRILLGAIGGGSFEWSPDGTWLAASSVEESIYVWESDGALKHVLPGGKKIYRLSWSPDGGLLASSESDGDKDHSVRLWSKDGEQSAILKGGYRGFDWHPNGESIALIVDDKTVEIRKPDGQSQGKFKVELGAHRGNIAWSPSGKWIAVRADHSNRLFLCNRATSEVRVQTLDVVQQLAFAWVPNEDLLGVSCSSPNRFYLLNPDGESTFFDWGLMNIRELRWCPNGRSLLVPEYSRTAMRVVSREGKIGNTFEGGLGTEWTPSGDSFATFSQNDNSIRIYDSNGRLLRSRKESSPLQIQLTSRPNGPGLICRAEGSDRFQLWEPTGASGPVFEGHDGPISMVQWNHQGHLLASGGEDGIVRIWDPDGKPGPILEPFAGPIRQVDWHPNGKKLLTVSGNDEIVRTWNVDGAQSRPYTHGAAVTSAEWSPDGESMLVACGDATVRLWDSNGRPRPAIQTQSGNVSVAWSPSGDFFATKGKDVRVWTVAGKPVFVLDEVGYSIAWRPDGAKLVTYGSPASQESAVRVRNLDGTINSTLEAGRSLPHYAYLAWSPDGKQIATGDPYGSVRVYGSDGRSLTLLEGHRAEFRSVAWSSDNSLVAATSNNSTCIVWDSQSADPVWGIVYLEDGSPVTYTAAGEIVDGPRDVIEKSLVYIVEYDDGKVEMMPPSKFAKLKIDLDLKQTPADRQAPVAPALSVNVEPVLNLPAGKGEIRSIAISPDGKSLAAASTDSENKPTIWDLKTGEVRLRIQDSTGRINSVAYSPDGKTIATTDNGDNTVAFWSALNGEKELVLPGCPFGTFSGAFSPDGSLFAAGAGGRAETGVLLLDLKERKEIRTLSGHFKLIWSVNFSPGGKLLASGDQGRNVLLWDLKSMRRVATVEHLASVHSVAFSPDSKLLASGSADATVKLWDLEENQLRDTLIPPPSPVWGLAFSPDGKVLVSSCGDGAVTIWDPHTSTELKTFASGLTDARSVAISPDGKTLAVAGAEVDQDNSNWFVKTWTLDVRTAK